MKTKTIQLFEFSELKPEAKEKALNAWRAGNDYFFLGDVLNERLHELLEENEIKDLNDTSKPKTKPTQVLYSLSNNQGDGAMFEGRFKWKDYIIVVKHQGHYSHYNSKSLTIYNDDNINDDEVSDDKIRDEFNNIYIKICKTLEREGYNFIEYEDSLESFQETCEANDYTFREDGTMENL